MIKTWEIISKIKNQKVKSEDITRLLLHNRGIITKQQQKEFFNPPHPDTLQPRDFGIDPDQLQKALKRIKKARTTGEKVIIWGDYDADGICGSAVLWEALHDSGVNAMPFIPERRTEGYGLNIARMKQLKEEDSAIGLIITVDNGIVAHEKVDTAKELGVDVIITDHHLPRTTRPKAFAVLHTVAISGAGVAWVLAREITAIADHLGLVALATIADMVPLVGPARSLVYHGLPALCDTDRAGIRALCEVASINQKTIGAVEASFVLAPRINAMGRLEHALDSLRLLCVKTFPKAQQLAQRLAQVNVHRQQLVVETVTRARQKVLNNTIDGVIVVADRDYHEGIIGLVAARLVEEFGHPAAVIAQGQELSKGSMRSVAGFNIVGLLDASRDILVEGGGHPMAAGFTVRTEHIEILISKFKEYAGGNLTAEMLMPRIRVEAEIPLTAATLELAGSLERFAPFGVGNPQPVFVSRGVMVKGARLVGKDGKHIKLRLEDESTKMYFEAIGFGMGSLGGQLSPGKLIDIAYCVEIDRWPAHRRPIGRGEDGNNNERLQLRLRDIKID